MTTLCLADLNIESCDKKVEPKDNKPSHVRLIQTLQDKPEMQGLSEES